MAMLALANTRTKRLIGRKDKETLGKLRTKRAGQSDDGDDADADTDTEERCEDVF